jgi:ATP-dependent DNA ligase
VVQLKWEGLVIRLNGDIWKVKPNCDVDVAIIGVNKNNKGYEEGKAKSLKMALMNEEGDYVEIGDCSGIGEEESKQLFDLTKSFKIGEDGTTVFVQPIVITTVRWNENQRSWRNNFGEAEESSCQRLQGRQESLPRRHRTQSGELNGAMENPSQMEDDKGQALALCRHRRQQERDTLQPCSGHDKI